MAEQMDLFGPPKPKKKGGLDIWENWQKTAPSPRAKIDALFNDPPPARERALESMDLVTKNADKKQREESKTDAQWSLSVREGLETWCQIKGPGYRFITEQFWAWGESEGHFKEPHKRQAYGSIMSAAARESKKYGPQIIKWIEGGAKSKNPRGHGHPITLWEVI